MKKNAWFLFTVYITFLTGCASYRVKIVDPLSNKSIVRQLKKEDKYFILHIGEEVYHLKDITIDNDNSAVKGVMEALPINHSYYKTAKPNPKANRFKYPDDPQDKPTHEIHIYATAVSGKLDAEANIPFSSIYKIDLYVNYGVAIGIAFVFTGALLYGLAYAELATGLGFY